jgi:CRP/FNR family transcriptional regulator, dissimilatory nitrate respiration regulator
MPGSREGTKVTRDANAARVSVEATPLFVGLNAAALRTLRTRAIERRFAADETLFMAGAPARGLFIILEGSVRVVRTRAGRQHVIHLEGPLGTLGEVPLYAGGGYPATAIAAMATRCAVITTDTLATMMVEDPALSWRLLETLARRVRGLVERVDALATQDVATRLAAHLLARTTLVGAREVATVAGTQAELAEELGTVREVVVRHLRALQQDGILRRLAPRRYEVLRPAALREAAGAAG